MQKINSCLRNYTSRGSFIVKDTKILVIDDRQVDFSLERDLKYLFGINSDVYGSTIDVLARIAEKKYDIIFVDSNLINNDFENMVRQIRDLGERYKKMTTYFMSVPIIVLVANNSLGARKIVLGEGVDDFVPLPVEIYYIDRMIKKWLPSNKRVARQDKFDSSTAAADDDDVINNEVDSELEHDFYSDLVVDGINMEKVMKACEFSKKKYIQFIGESYKKGISGIESIENCIRRSDMANFVEKIHSLKEFSKAIGCDVLYEMSKTLEIAAYSGNYNYVYERASNLLEKYYMLLSSMGEVLTKNNFNNVHCKEDEKLPISYMEFQNEIFHVLMYLDDIRPHTAVKAIRRLLGCKISSKMIARLKKVIEHIDDMDYEKAMLHLTEILRSQEMSL